MPYSDSAINPSLKATLAV